MEKFLMKYVNKDNDECIVITNEDDELFVFNKFEMKVYSYSTMGSIIDILYEIDLEDVQLWIAEEYIDGFKEFLRDNSDDIKSDVMFAIMNNMKVVQ